MTPELRECPFCGAAGGFALSKMAPNLMGWIECGSCGARGPRQMTVRQKVEEAWNTRHKPDTEESQRLRLRLQEMDAELVRLRGQVAARAGLRKELEEALGITPDPLKPHTGDGALEAALTAIQALKADTVRLRKLAAIQQRCASNGKRGVFFVSLGHSVESDFKALSLDDLRTALDALPDGGERG